ncbi:MAG: hypothetical protein VX519_04790 [Myxococcota bacterium]|nr:hypothetical protein [Myxococcota bacterium]
MGPVGIVWGVIPLLILFFGCSSGTPLEQCDQLAEASWREDCRYQELVNVAADGERQAILDSIALSGDKYSRDLLRFRLAIRDPKRLGWLCDEGLETALVESRCQAILRRAHLNHTEED